MINNKNYIFNTIRKFWRNSNFGETKINPFMPGFHMYVVNFLNILLDREFMSLPRMVFIGGV